MILKSIRGDLQLYLAPNPVANSDDEKVVGFLTELEESREISGLRLLLCLGIDVKNSLREFKSGHKTKNPIVSIIYNCIVDSYNNPIDATKTLPNGVPPQIRFSSSLKKFSPSFYSPYIIGNGKHNYSRISSFQSFLRNVVKMNLTLKTTVNLPGDIDDSEPNRYLLDFLHDHKYNNVEITRLGRINSWVFVADHDELESINYKSGDKTEEIIDRLGFYIDNVTVDNHYVCLKYDNNFSEDLFQPDVLTGDWGSIDIDGKIYVGNEFFLSHPIGNAEWGQTQSVTGTKPSLRERVHQNFDHNENKYYNMTVDSIGVLRSPMGKGNMASLILEAVKRYEKA